MAKKKTAIIAAAALLIVLLLGVWRFWPRPLSSVIGVEQGAVTGMACTVLAGGVENGKPYINGYTLSELSPQEDGFKEILTILDSSDYRPDLRNLLPWGIDSIGSDEANGVQTASVVFVWGSGVNESCILSIQGKNTVAVSGGSKSGLKVYHPTNREILNMITTYLQAHGNKT